MRTVITYIRKRIGTVAVDLHPENVVVVDGAQDLQVALCFEIEIQIQQNVHVLSSAVTQCFQTIAQVSDDSTIGVQFRIKRRGKPGTPGVGRAVIENESVGFECRKTAFTRL